jgi:hypothetical protein
MNLEDLLRELPRIEAPPDFAVHVAKNIAFSAALHQLELTHPPPQLGPDFASSLASRIAQDALEHPVVTQTSVSPPPNFATSLAVRIAEDANPFVGLEPIQAPTGFASTIAARIAMDAAHLPMLATLPRVETPPLFASSLALRIAQDANPELAEAEHDRTPLYFLATLLGGVALALAALTWRDVQAAGAALFEVLRVMPESLLLPVLMVGVFAAFGTMARRSVRLPVAMGAFGVAAVAVIPQVLPFFGNTRVDGSAQLSSIVRFAGDITVASEVRGDVIAIGGSVRFEPGARVSGRVLTFIGDVNLPDQTSARAVSAVLGSLTTTTSSGIENTAQKSVNLPGLSAASALRPLRELISAGSWQWWYFALIAALAIGLMLAPKLYRALEMPLTLEAGRSLSLGLLLAFLAVPTFALGGLSIIGAPFALLLGVLGLIGFSSGAALALLCLGGLLTPNSRWLMPLPGLLGFALAILFPPFGLIVWLLAGAWGVGAILISLREGQFVRALN